MRMPRIGKLDSNAEVSYLMDLISKGLLMATT